MGRVCVGLLKIKLAHITKKKLDFLVYLHHDMSYQEIYDARILQIKIKIQNYEKTNIYTCFRGHQSIWNIDYPEKIPFSFDVKDLCSHHKGVKK